MYIILIIILILIFLYLRMERNREMNKIIRSFFYGEDDKDVLGM
jgi:hypothetical protein